MTTRFAVGDVIHTRGGKTPWRIEAIAQSISWLHHGRTVYECRSLTSGRREEYRLTNTLLELWDGPLPAEEPKQSRVKGHMLVSEGAPHNERGMRLGNGWSPRGSGRGKCSCGLLSDVLPSAAQRKQWHKSHKDAIRAAVSA